MTSMPSPALDSMKADTHQTLDEVCRDERTLRQQLLQSMNYISDRAAAEDWARKLRFLTPGGNGGGGGVGGGVGQLTIARNRRDNRGIIPGHGLAPDIPLDGSGDAYARIHTNEIAERMDERNCVCQDMVTRRFDWDDAEGPKIFDLVTVEQCTHYTAVSYCWPSAGQPARPTPTQEQIYIRLPDVTIRPARSPVGILRRAIRHAAQHADCLLWIDQECIDQDDEQDQEVGIQAMDLVYQRAHHVAALIGFQLDHKLQMDCLAKWCAYVTDDEDAFGVPVQIPETEARVLCDILRGVVNDRWFTRAWCAHERFCARELWPSIGFVNEDGTPARYRRTPAQREDYSDLGMEASVTAGGWPEGEAILDVDHLSQNVDQFGTALEKGLRGELRGLTSRLRQIWDRTGNEDANRHNIGRALRYILPQQCRFDSDKLAMLANICKYPKRINTREAASAGLSFSVCVFALAIANGDETVFCADEEHVRRPDQEDMPEYRDPLASVPKKWASSWVPRLGTKVDDIRCCQERRALSIHSITSRGLNTQGWLWQMTHFIDVSTLTVAFNKPPARCPQPSIIVKDVETAIKQMLWWQLLRLFLLRGLQEIAETIWEILRPETGPPKMRTSDYRGYIDNRSGLLGVVMDPETGNYIHQVYVGTAGQRFPMTEDEFVSCLSIADMDSLGWLAEAVLKNGGLRVGVPAEKNNEEMSFPVVVSDVSGKVDEGCRIFSQHVASYTPAKEVRIVEVRELHGSKITWVRNQCRTRPLSWKLESSTGSKGIVVLGQPCNVLFSHGRIPAVPVSLAWPQDV